MTKERNAARDALLAAGLELIKVTPALGALIEGVRTFHESLENQQREEFITALGMRVGDVEASFRDPWYRTAEGKRVCSKILATALNAEFCDKTDYLANALLNAPRVATDAERLKFVEILRHISKPALIILAAQGALVDRDPSRSPQPDVPTLVLATSLDPRVVEACIIELGGLGVLSPSLRMDQQGQRLTYYGEGLNVFNPFSKRFLEFVRDPRGTNDT